MEVVLALPTADSGDHSEGVALAREEELRALGHRVAVLAEDAEQHLVNLKAPVVDWKVPLVFEYRAPVVD